MNNSLRLTPIRKKILTIIEKSCDLITAKEILNQDPSLDKVTVYRTLETFLKTGLIREFYTASSEKAYELGDHHNHHHHFSCELCKQIYHLPCEFDHTVKVWEQKTGFQFQSFDFRGVCKKCLSKI